MVIDSIYKLNTVEPIPDQFIGYPSLSEYEASITI